MTTNNVYHPDYGYPDSFRMQVCKTAYTKGKKVAARQHGVALSSVYSWTKTFTFEAVMRGDKVYIVRGDKA